MESLNREMSSYGSRDEYLSYHSTSSQPLPSNGAPASNTENKVEVRRSCQQSTWVGVDGGRERNRFGETKRNEGAFAPLGRKSQPNKARYSRTLTGSQGEILSNDGQPSSSQQSVSSPIRPTSKPTKRTRESLDLVVPSSGDVDGSDLDENEYKVIDGLSSPKHARLNEKNGNVLRGKGKGKEKARDLDDHAMEEGDWSKKSKVIIKRKRKVTDKEPEKGMGKEIKRDTRRPPALLSNPKSSPSKYPSQPGDPSVTITRPKPRIKRPPPVLMPPSSNLDPTMDLISIPSSTRTPDTSIPETPRASLTFHRRSRSTSRTHDDGMSASPISPFKQASIRLPQRKQKNNRISKGDESSDSLEDTDGEYDPEWEKSSPSRTAPFPMTLPSTKTKSQTRRTVHEDDFDEMEDEGLLGVSASGRMNRLSLEVDELGSDGGSEDELMLKPSRGKVDHDLEPVEDGRLKSLLTGGRAERFCKKFISTTEKCPYCSEPLPKRQSVELVQRLSRLAAAAPITGDSSPHWTRTIGACKLHRAETHIIPLGELAGYPRTLVTADLKRRLKSTEIMKDVEQVLLYPSRSAWFHFAKRDIEDAGGRRKWLSCGLLQSAAVLERLQPGYYGEIGRRVISQVLTSALGNRLSDAVNAALFEPLERDDLIHHVLIPEIAVSLTRQDLGSRGEGQDGRDLAIRIVKESREYGQARFGEVDVIVATPLLASSKEPDPQLVHVLSDDSDESDVERTGRSRPITENAEDEDEFDDFPGSFAPEQLVQAVEVFDPPLAVTRPTKAKPPTLASWVHQQGRQATKQEPSYVTTRPDRPPPKARNKATLGMRIAYPTN